MRSTLRCITRNFILHHLGAFVLGGYVNQKESQNSKYSATHMKIQREGESFLSLTLQAEAESC